MLQLFEQLTPEIEAPGAVPHVERTWEMSSLHIAAAALVRLWEERELAGTPMLFRTKGEEKPYHPALLEKAIERGSKRKRLKKGQLCRWERLSAPSSAGEIGATPLHDSLYESDLLGEACLYDHHTVAGPFLDGWFAYYFDGWTALAVRLAAPDKDDAIGIIIVPEGRQDDWLAFQVELRQASYGVLRRKRKNHIDVLGSPGDGSRLNVESDIRKATFEQVILPQEVIDRVTGQQTIFQPEILARYQALRIPRLRKVLLIGPPGTGKTTLVKVLAAEHVKRGGYVAYVFADEGNGSSWNRLRHALESAVSSGLPTLVVVEDLENFVSPNNENMQPILNALDGVTTPDNPAGTLLLATTNAPERIDRRITQRPGRIDVMIEIGAIKDESLAIRFLERFLHTAYNSKEHNPIARRMIGQVGSHVREVCILAAIHAVEDARDHVTFADLTFAHDALLAGRQAAADLDTCEPPEAKERAGLGFGGKK